MAKHPGAGGERQRARRRATENFITRFARYYTPAVVGIAAVLLAVVPPLLLGMATGRTGCSAALIFLVVSCPCALVISVPLSLLRRHRRRLARWAFWSRAATIWRRLPQAETVVFDKTGTLTNGSFNVAAVHPAHDIDPEQRC